jgi:Uma2 family endonuclease
MRAHIPHSEFRDAVDHLPPGAVLTLSGVSWDAYERLLDDLADRGGVRTAYDRGRLEIVSPSRAHEAYACFIDDLVRAFADHTGRDLEKRGRLTLKKSGIARGAEPDCSYDVRTARPLGPDPPARIEDSSPDTLPDIVVEIDLGRESLSKFSVYAALEVPEIWRYDGRSVEFYGSSGRTYVPLATSAVLAGLSPEILAAALDQSRRDGQSKALQSFRGRLG